MGLVKRELVGPSRQNHRVRCTEANICMSFQDFDLLACILIFCPDLLLFSH